MVDSHVVGGAGLRAGHQSPCACLWCRRPGTPVCPTVAAASAPTQGSSTSRSSPGVTVPLNRTLAPHASTTCRSARGTWRCRLKSRRRRRCGQCFLAHLDRREARHRHRQHPLPPGVELPGADAVPVGNRLHHRPRHQGLAHDPQLVFVGPRSMPLGANTHLHCASGIIPATTYRTAV